MSKSSTPFLILLIAMVLGLSIYFKELISAKSPKDRPLRTDETLTHASSSENETSRGNSASLANSSEDIIAVMARKSPDEIRAQWQQLRDQGEYPSGRSESLRQLALLISAGGHTDLAVELLLEDIGPGSLRTSAMQFCFAEAKCSAQEIKNIYLRLTFSEDLKAGAHGIGSLFGSRLLNGEISLDEIDFSFLKEHSREATSALVTEHYRKNIAEGFTVNPSAFDDLFDQRFSPEMLGPALVAASWFDPSKAWDKLVEEDLIHSDLDISEVINQLMGNHPDKVLESIEKNQIPSKFAEEIVRKSLERDSIQAIRWLEDHKGQFSPEVADRLQSGVAKYCVQSGRNEFDTAWEWAGKIENNDIRKEAEGAIWNTERNYLVKQLETAPEETLASITQENPLHQDFWLKEMFAHWSGQDAAAADQWYEAKRTSLTPVQNQHVARVYANQAIRAGDLSLASQWLEQIIDPKFVTQTQERIEEAKQASQSR